MFLLKKKNTQKSKNVLFIYLQKKKSCEMSLMEMLREETQTQPIKGEYNMFYLALFLVFTAV